MTNPRAPIWTETELDVLRRRITAGDTAADIAVALNRTADGVQAKAYNVSYDLGHQLIANKNRRDGRETRVFRRSSVRRGEKTTKDAALLPRVEAVEKALDACLDLLFEAGEALAKEREERRADQFSPAPLPPPHQHPELLALINDLAARPQPQDAISAFRQRLNGIPS